MELVHLTQLFKCLSDPVRLRIINLLFQQPLTCVCDIVTTLGLPQSVVSRHLAYLRKYNLVCAERRGNWQYYSHCLFSKESTQEQVIMLQQLKVILEGEPMCRVDIENMALDNQCCVDDE